MYFCEIGQSCNAMCKLLDLFIVSETKDQASINHLVNECKLCTKRYFKNENLLAEHIQIYHKRTLQCEECGKSFDKFKKN